MKYLATLILISSMPAFAALKVSSPNLKPGGTMSEEQVFNGFGCNGQNISPQLEWKDAPAGTKSFAVTAYDPDAPTGSGWWHWTVFNIPASVVELPAGAGNDATKLPAGAAQGRTDFGKPGFGGACPPAGDKPHHYIFTVYALKTDKLDLNGDSSGAMVGFMVKQNTLAKQSITVTYGRQK